MKYYLYIFLLLTCGALQPAQAQQTGTIRGTVRDQKNQALAGVNVSVINTTKGTSTDAEGRFTLSSVPLGAQKIAFSFVGFKTETRSVAVKAGQTLGIAIQLKQDAVMLQGISVTALLPDLDVITKLQQDKIREANPRDSGELLRNVSGVSAVRRGPIGLDPVVRGLRETEVGTYLDGTRIFPGGPARMDSPLSHLDPSAIQTINVVKGPYALTWGAGNMSAVRVQTQPLNTLQKPLGGSFSSGYDSNYNGLDEAGSIYGTSGKVGYWVHGAWRKGQDYQSGDGTTVPADFLSREIRGKVGYATTSDSYLDLSLGYQNQANIDYPGRLLNAAFFHTYNAALHWNWNPKNTVVKSIKASIYRNEVHHGMTNNGKPTALPDPNRKPPFALDIGVKAHAYVSGGKLSADIATGPAWDWKVGADIYSANRDAVRTINRKDNGQHLFTDLMWPDATITDGGVYSQVSHNFSDRLHATSTVRLDLVSAAADTISQFFKDNVDTDLNTNETNLNGAGTLSYLPFENWEIGVGLGSVARTADATERYSDRVPASKAQTSAEFVGNPALKPERNTQADLWISAAYPKWRFSLNGFTRHMSDYITIKPTSLSKRLPLSPNTVYQYTNGNARFWGFDASASYRIIQTLNLKAGLNYLYGRDTKLDEPALGIAPFTVDTGLRYDSSRWPLFMEGTIHFAGKQTRVATLKGETPTDGYITADLQAGATVTHWFSVQAGVKNVTDKQYVNHLNAKNPFTGQPIAEPGRVIFGNIQFNF